MLSNAKPRFVGVGIARRDRTHTDADPVTDTDTDTDADTDADADADLRRGGPTPRERTPIGLRRQMPYRSTRAIGRRMR
jgi:hypothetical protein